MITPARRGTGAAGMSGVCARVKVGCLQYQNSSVTLSCLRSSFEKECEGKNGESGGGGGGGSGLRINARTLM